MNRAVAPASRIASKNERIECDPSIFWSPYRLSPSACSIFTRFQSASSSSATRLDSIPLDQLLSRGAHSNPPFARKIQMGFLFHPQNHCRKILLRSFVRLPRIDLKSSSRCGHSRANGSREIENQPEILVHEP